MDYTDDTHKIRHSGYDLWLDISFIMGCFTLPNGVPE